MRKAIAGIIIAVLSCSMAFVIGCSAPAASSGGASASASSASAQDQGASAAAIDPANLADGDYQVAVTLEGGSGKATVESPAKLIVENGKMTAVIVWSSPNYDQMIVDGEQYLPVPRDGNSTFEIPVSAFDKDLPVQAETTAMSQPHMIDYTLNFDSSTITSAA